MASLTMHGSGSAAGLRQAKAQAKVCAGSISSMRVKPFTSATRSLAKQQPSVRTRAAEPEVAGPAEAEEAFEFNLSDAKKGNEYSTSDVEAALAFYEGEGDAPGQVNSEFVENVFGIEDAAFFDEVDNNEAYDDEFVAAGIPEAAPKQRRGGPSGPGGEEEEEGDEFSAAREQAKLRAVEEDMIMEAELEELGLDKEEAVVTKAIGPAVWDWMGDTIEAEDDEVSTMAKSGSRRMAANVLAALPSDEEIFSDLRNANLADVDTETRDIVQFLLDDFDLDAELKAIPEDVAEAFEEPEEGPSMEADLARIDALLSEDLSLPELDMSGLDVPELVDDGLTMSDAAADKYLASLRAAGSDGMSEEEVQSLFADDPAAFQPVTEAAAVTTDDVDLSEPVVETLSAEELRFQAVEDNGQDIADVEDLRMELASLQRLDDIDFDMPTEEEVEVLDQYLAAGEVFFNEVENRRIQLAQQVAAGALPPDVLLEETNDVIDVESELLTMDEDDEEEETVGALGDGEDEDNWQERILELTRVTKVVKGGKLMGFRCTAIIGNGKGLVGVGCQAGREIATAVKRALVDAKKNIVRVPLVGAGTIPHRVEAKFNAARCVMVPAADGTGVLAGSSIRSVLELAGVQNVLAKRIGCRSLLNNARCAIAALEQLRTLDEVSKARGVPMERLLLPRE